MRSVASASLPPFGTTARAAPSTRSCVDSGFSPAVAWVLVRASALRYNLKSLIQGGPAEVGKRVDKLQKAVEVRSSLAEVVERISGLCAAPRPCCESPCVETAWGHCGGLLVAVAALALSAGVVFGYLLGKCCGRTTPVEGSSPAARFRSLRQEPVSELTRLSAWSSPVPSPSALSRGRK